MPRDWEASVRLLGVEEGGRGIEVFEEASLARGVGGLLDHVGKNGLEEAGVFRESGLIVGGESGFDGLFGGWSDEFKTANEDADGVGGSGGDAERKNGIHEAAGNDVDEA